MKYLIYLRVSTDRQDEETQLHYCLGFIKNRHQGHFEYEVFKDVKTSRKSLFNRDGGASLLNALKDGDIIIAMRLDRLSRRLHETTQLIEVMEKKGCEILLVEQPGITNKIMLGLYAGMAEEEIKLLRMRVKEKLQVKKAKGERYSRFLPYGFAMHETKTVGIRVENEIVQKRGILVPLHEEQQALALMKKLFQEGMNYQQIAKALTSQGYKNREGKPFHKMSIYRILSRRENTIMANQLHKEVESKMCFQ